MNKKKGTRKIYRDAKTGRFVTRKYVEKRMKQERVGRKPRPKKRSKK